MKPHRARGCMRTTSARAAWRKDLPAGLEARIAAWAETFPKFIDDLEELLTGNRIWKQRTVDIGVMDARAGAGLGLHRPVPARERRAVGPASVAALRQIRRGGLSGPGRTQRRLLRPLSGAARRDAREREDHPPGAGEAAARPGEGAGPQVHAAARAEMKRSMEALIHHFKLYTEGYHVPPGATYTVVESPKGEFGVYLVADGTNRPYRCKIRSTGFAFLQAIDVMAKRPYAGGHGGDHRVARHRVRRDRQVDHGREQRRPISCNRPASLSTRRARRRFRRFAKYPPGKQASAVIPMLYLVQNQMKRQTGSAWVPTAGMDEVARRLDMAPIRVYEVATFYLMFNLRPIGTWHLQVCTTTPCWLRGSDEVVAACRAATGIQGWGETSADGMFTMTEVECVGACVNAPVIQVNDDFYEDLDARAPAVAGGVAPWRTAEAGFGEGTPDLRAGRRADDADYAAVRCGELIDAAGQRPRLHQPLWPARSFA